MSAGRADYRRRMQAVRNFVAAHLDQSHSVEDLARVANLSKYHFHRVHHALTGETAQGMVNRLRLEAAAATLIYQPAQSITRVAMDHGYSSSANFAKAFQKHFGTSPSAYRENSKIGNAKPLPTADDALVELDVTFSEEPERRLAYLRRQGEFQHMRISAMHAEIEHWAEQRGCLSQNAASIGITWSDSLITDVEQWVYDACIEVDAAAKADKRIDVQTLPGGRIAQVEVVIADGESHDLSTYWDQFVRGWLVESGEQLRNSPSYERYLADEDAFRVRLCLPIQS